MAELWLKRGSTGRTRTPEGAFEVRTLRRGVPPTKSTKSTAKPTAHGSAGGSVQRTSRFGMRKISWHKRHIVLKKSVLGIFAAGEFSLWRQSTTSSVEKARTSPCRKRRYVKIPAELLLPSWTSNKNFFSSELLQYRVPLRLFSYFRGRDVLFCLFFLVYSHQSLLWSPWLTFPMGF